MKTIMLASEEARRLRQHSIGSEFLLLGLLSSGGTAGPVLNSVGVRLDPAREAVAKLLGWGSVAPPIVIPFTPRAKKILEMASSEAKELNQAQVTTKHILLGLVDEASSNQLDEEGLASKILRSFNVDFSDLRLRAVKANDRLTMHGSPD